MKLNWWRAEQWAEKVNESKEYYDPKWNWDCGFKLDFGGSLLSVTSRFYPPHKNKGDWWEGDLDISFLGKKISTKRFKEDTLDELHLNVETYVREYTDSIKDKL